MPKSPSELAAVLPDGCAIALSGGVDSVVLLDAAVAASRRIFAVHVDHGLRPDSGEDAAFCARFAAARGVPFELVEVQVPRGNSTQGRARTQRYAALVRAAARLGAAAIATAHHGDDVAETHHMQADRGAGPIGVAGPRARGDWWGFPILRPFLPTTRREIEAWAVSRGLDWREDPTNRDHAYARSRVRAELAEGSRAAPDLVEVREEAAELSRQTDALSRSALRPERPGFRLFDRARLRGSTPATMRVLLDAARGVSGELPGPLVEEVVAAIDDDESRSRRFCGRRVLVEVSRDYVVVEASRGHGTKLLDGRSAIAITWRPENGAVQWFDHEIGPAAEGILLPRDIELTIAGPIPGKRIRCLRGGGSKKLSDVLAEAGIPSSVRWRWPCAYIDGRCIWVVGLCTDVDLDKDFSSKSPETGILVASCAFPDTASRGADAREPSD